MSEKEPSGEEHLLNLIKSARDGRSDEEITRDVEAIIEDVMTRPRSGIYFDRNDGWKVDPLFEKVERDIAQNRERLIVIEHSSMLDRGGE